MEDKEKRETNVETVRRHIKDNGDQTLEEVAEATEVSVKKILKYIKEGRIEVSDNSSMSYECESCGKPIYKGRYCSICAKKIQNKFSNSFAKPSEQPSKPKSVMYSQQNK